MTNETKEAEKPAEGEFKEVPAANGDTAIAVVPESNVTVVRDPADVIAEAQKVAETVTKLLKAKPKPVIIRGEHYLEISDWGFVAQCYGATAYTEYTRPVDRTAEGLGRGWEARALVIDLRSGNTVGAAEAECLDSEEEWGKRPEYKWFDEGKVPEELKPAIVDKMPSKYGRGMRYKVLVGHEDVPDAARRSMAQTRAGSRALAQRFRWVVALAGYKGTPAEEMKRKDYDSGGDYESGDVVTTANAQADQRKLTAMDPKDVDLIKQTVKVMIEQAKANDPVATAVQTAWNAWLTGAQGPGRNGKDAVSTYGALFADDSYTYAAKRILGITVEPPKAAPVPTTTADTHPKFDPDNVAAEQRAQGEGPAGVRPMHTTPAAAPAPAREPNDWPVDEQRFIRDTYNAIVGIKKNASKRETPAAVAQAQAVFNAFAAWMNAQKFNWSGEQGYTSIWKRYDQHEKVYELLGLAAPPAPEKPGFDPDEEAV